MYSRKRIDVEKGECLLTFEQLQTGDVAYEWNAVNFPHATCFRESARTLDDLAENAVCGHDGNWFS